MSGETEQDSRLLEVGCIGALSVSIAVMAAMCMTTALPDIRVPPVLGFLGGGGLALLVFVVALRAYFRRDKAEQDDDEPTD